MKISCFATAVAFEFLCGYQVRDHDVVAGTMGRFTSFIQSSSSNREQVQESLDDTARPVRFVT